MNGNDLVQYSILAADITEYELVDNYPDQTIYKEVLEPSPEEMLSTNGSSVIQIHDDKVQDLLTKWNLGLLISIFQDECIDMEALLLMNNRHIQKLVNKYDIKLGTEIKLEKYINDYQASQRNTECSQILDIHEIQEHEHKPPNTNRGDVKLDVKCILENSVQGRTILEQYIINQTLNEGSRAIIVETIINHMIQTGIRMTIAMAKEISEHILQIFPSEFMAYYFSQRLGKKPQGKIYDKYFNSQRQLKASGILSKRSYSLKTDILEHDNAVELEPPETNITEQLATIFSDNCSWAELEHHWQATKNYRLNDITKADSTMCILSKWKHYKKPLGYKLVNIDFHQLYPSASSLIINFEAFALKVIPIFKDKIKDPNSKKMLEELQQSQYATESGRCCAIFQLLHSVLVPTTTTVEGANNKRIRIKHSISDSQGSFLVLGSTVGECEEQISRRNSFKIPIQPLIIVTGTILAPKEFLVYFDGVKYILKSFIDAVDICFKIFNVFNLEYPVESNLVWKFIQKYFYAIQTKYDKPNIHVDCLISALK